MEKVCPENLCTGCSACLNICPHNAITMKANFMGFLYPHINQQNCIDCKLCQKICPVNTPPQLRYPIATFAAYSKNKALHRSAASGGVASELSKLFLEKKGVVYGCSQNNYLDIKHIRIDTIEHLHLLYGSKYVQSNLNKIFTDVKSDLQNKIEVLFIGTPCQVAGLKNFLKKDYNNLTTIDLVCHGVPSSQVLQESIEYYPLIHKSQVDDIIVSFRKKTSIGIRYGIFLSNKQTQKTILSKYAPNDAYITCFLSGLSLRNNCHVCRYAQPLRVSDITLADFWGLKSKKKLKNEGTSLVLINTTKGMQLLQGANQHLTIEERNIDEAIKGNGQLQHPAPTPPNKKQFQEIYEKEGINHAYKACCEVYIKKIKQSNIQLYKNFVKESFPFLNHFFQLLKKTKL